MHEGLVQYGKGKRNRDAEARCVRVSGMLFNCPRVVAEAAEIPLYFLWNLSLPSGAVTVAVSSPLIRVLDRLLCVESMGRRGSGGFWTPS